MGANARAVAARKWIQLNGHTATASLFSPSSSSLDSAHKGSGHDDGDADISTTPPPPPSSSSVAAASVAAASKSKVKSASSLRRVIGCTFEKNLLSTLPNLRHHHPLSASRVGSDFGSGFGFGLSAEETMEWLLALVRKKLENHTHTNSTLESNMK